MMLRLYMWKSSSTNGSNGFAQTNRNPLMVTSEAVDSLFERSTACLLFPSRVNFKISIGRKVLKPRLCRLALADVTRYTDISSS